MKILLAFEFFDAPAATFGDTLCASFHKSHSPNSRIDSVWFSPALKALFPKIPCASLKKPGPFSADHCAVFAKLPGLYLPDPDPSQTRLPPIIALSTHPKSTVWVLNAKASQIYDNIMHDPLSIPSQATQAATDKARQQIPPQFLSTDGSSFTEPANLLVDNEPPKHIHTLLPNSMTALLDSIAGFLRLAAHMARQNIPKPNQKHGIVPAPPPLWIRPAQQICIEAERLRSTQLLETKSETLSLDIQQRILTHAQTVPFAHPILSKLPLAPPFPLQPFYECASLCTQRLHASGRAFSNGKWSPSPTTSRGNHNTLKQNLEYLKLGGNQNDGIIDGLIGEAPSAAELEPDTEKLIPLQPMVKAFRVNAQALTHIIKKSMMDWTSDKTQGPHAFTFPSIAAASLYETTFRRDGSPTATLFESTTQSESLCSMKLQAWKATVNAA